MLTATRQSEEITCRRRLVLSAAAVWCIAAMCGAQAQTAEESNTLPVLDRVSAGTATVRQSGARLDIDQTTDKAIVDWQTFNVGRDAHVNFNQPSSSSVALNRVLDTQASQIYGRLTANGQVFLANSQGVYFAPGAQVDVGALVATTHRISDDNFLNRILRFTRVGSGGAVINEADLHAHDRGYLALLADEVRNDGVMTARLGTVALAAGEAFTLQFDDGLLSNVVVDESHLRALVENRRAIVTPGGMVILAARAANSLLGGVVNNSGHIAATGLAVHDGVIVLDASNAIESSGTLDASNASGDGGRVEVHAGDTAIVTGMIAVDGTGTHGGRVTVTAAQVGLFDNAAISANGQTGGGQVYVGGGWQGNDHAIRKADAVVMSTGARIDANAIDHGDGGTVVLWSERYTGFYGQILARGGGTGGNGGSVETSSHDNLQAIGAVDAGAAFGSAGVWLLDPRNVTITSSTANGSFDSGSPNTFTPTADNASANVSTINTSLSGGTSVTITTGSTGAQQGRITLSSAIAKSGNNTATLTLNAAQDIILDAGISASNGILNVVLEPGTGSIVANQDITTNGGSLDFKKGVYVGGAGVRSFTTKGGAVDFRGDLLIGNTNGLTINSTNAGADGAVTFHGKVDSGNTYTYVAGAVNWDTALASAKSGNGDATGDTYLATITSQLENSIAGSAAGYLASWLGARRIVGLGTDANWRWVTGPEGLEDSGNGRQFFTQNSGSSGGTAINGAYTNWSTNEPNNWSGGVANQPLTTEYESTLQFTGTAGRWNDLARTSTSPLGYVRETNATPSPLTVNSGTATTTFTNLVGSNKALSAVSVTANTVAINGGGVTTSDTQTYNGNITLGAAATTLTQTAAGTDFTLPASRTTSNASGGNAALTIKTTRDIVFGDNSSIASSTGALAVTLWSDSDNDESGRVQAGSNVGISSNGGNITLGGGTNPASDYAVGRTASPNEDGIRFASNVTLNAAGGNISLFGKGGTGTGDNKGIEFDTGSQIITSGTGTITLNGVGGTNSGAGGSSYGVNLRQNSLVQSGSGAISIIGQGGSAGSGGSNHGVVIESDTPAAGAGYIQSGSGAITITGVSGDASAIRFTGNSYIGKGNLGASSSNIALVGDSISLATTAQVESSGTLTVRPNTASTTTGVGAGGGTLSLPQSYFWNGTTGIFKNGFSGITIGSASQTGVITIDGLDYSDPLTLQAGGAGGSIALAGALADGAASRAGALSLIANGAIAGAANITTADQNLLINTASGSGTLSGVLAPGAGGLTRQGAGTTVLSGANTYTGATTISAGILRAGAANVLSDSTAVTVAGGATYDLNSLDDTIGLLAGAGNVTLGSATLTTGANNGSSTFSGVASGTGGLTKQGSGTFTLSGSNAYSGATTINAGALQAGAANVLSDSTAVTITSGASYDLNGNDDTVASFAGGGNITLGAGTLTSNGSNASTTFSGMASGTGGLIKQGSGTLTLSGNNSYSGTTLVSAGSLAAAHANALGTTAGGTTVASGATLDLQNIGIGAEAVTLNGGTLAATTGTSSLSGAIALGADSNLNVSGTQLTLSGVVSGANALNKTGAGTAVLSGNNTYNGTTTVSAGTLIAAHANALGATAAGTTVADGATLLINSVVIGNEAVSINGTGVGRLGALQGSGTASLAGAVAASTSATVGGSGGLTLGALTIADGQTLTLGTGGALNLTTGATSGVGGGASSNLTVNTAGTATLGAVGTDIGAVNVAAADTTLNAVTANTMAVVDSGANGVTLDGVLTANANNDATALVIAAGQFTNNVGAGALATPNGSSRWLVYTATPASNTFGGLASGNQALWNKTYAGYAPASVVETGNRYLFSTQPTLAITASNKTKTYGDTVSLASPVLGTDYSVSGFATAATYGNVFTQDAAGNALSGAPTLASAGAAASAAVAGSPYALTIAAGTLAVGNGYATNYTNGTLTVDTKALTLPSLAASNKIYDGNTSAAISSYGALTGVIGADSVSLNSGGVSASFDTKNVGIGKTVTVSGLGLSGVSAGNYSIANHATTADITPKTVTIGGVAANNKVYDGNTSATLSGSGSLSGFVGSETLVLNAPATVTFASKNVGTGKTVTAAGYTIADGTNGGLASNYQLASASAAVTANITSRPVNLTGKAAVDRNYNGTVAMAVGEPGYAVGAGAGTGLVGGDSASIAGAAVYDGVNAGTHQVLRSSLALTGADAANYMLVWVDGSGTINQAPLTMTANAAAKIIFDTDPALTAGYSGFVNGETAAVLSNVTVARAAGEVSGAYTITPAATSANYVVTPVTGTFTIYPADTLLVVLNDATKFYGNPLPPLVVGSARYCPASSCTNATSIRALVLTNNGSDNWTAVDGLGGTASIDVSTSATAASPVGTYAITAAVAKTGNNNFNLIAVQGSDLVVTPRPVTVSTSAVSKTYDGGVGLTGATATITNIVGGDDVSVAGAGQYNNKNAGTPGYTLSGLSLSGAAAANYSLGSLASSGISGSGTINKATVAISGLAAQNKIYDATTAATFGSIGALSGLIGSETLVLNAPTTVMFDTRNVGVGKTVTASGYTATDGTSGGLAGNYQLASASVATVADITAKSLTLSGLAASDKVYDGNTNATVSGYGTLSGVIGADAVSLNSGGTSAGFNTRNVGIGKTVTVSGLGLSGTDAGNYSIANHLATADITAKNLTLAGLSAGDKVYDGNTNATVTSYGTLSGVIGVDAVSLNNGSASASFDTRSAGVGKTVTVSGLGLSGADVGNYAIADQTTTATISKRPLTVTADNKSRTEGETNPVLTATYAGWVNGETLATSGVGGSPLLTTTADSTSAPGGYDIVAAPGTLSAGNYDFRFVHGFLTVALSPPAMPGMRYIAGISPNESRPPLLAAMLVDDLEGVPVTIRCEAFGSIAATHPECAGRGQGQ